MLTELQDTSAEIFHDVFQQWRLDHQDGQFLTLETRTRANLHGAWCQHLGNAEWTVEPETGQNSLTKKRKVLGEDHGSLAAWAVANGVQVSLCKHCVRDGLVGPEDLEPRSTSVASEPMRMASTTEALEGQLLESTVFRYGRNASLRAAALRRANGVCDGCGTNFSKLFQGLGLSVLQVHHTVPVAGRSEPMITSVDDLAVLCANCHCLVHARPGLPMAIKELRRIYGSV